MIEPNDSRKRKTRHACLTIALCLITGLAQAAVVDTTIFNATTNTGGDEPAGLSTSFTNSALIAGFTIENAFGRAGGGSEPTNVIFSDSGTPDNGNGVMGDGGERVDFIQWHTTSMINLAGFQFSVSGDGGGTKRATELIRFYVEGVQVDLFDNNSTAGVFDRVFAGGPVMGDDFRIEFTRKDAFGPRIREINAILVPEPSSLLLVSLGCLCLLRRNRCAA